MTALRAAVAAIRRALSRRCPGAHSLVLDHMEWRPDGNGGGVSVWKYRCRRCPVEKILIEGE